MSKLSSPVRRLVSGPSPMLSLKQVARVHRQEEKVARLNDADRVQRRLERTAYAGLPALCDRVRTIVARSPRSMMPTRELMAQLEQRMLAVHRQPAQREMLRLQMTLLMRVVPEWIRAEEPVGNVPHMTKVTPRLAVHAVRGKLVRAAQRVAQLPLGEQP